MGVKLDDATSVALPRPRHRSHTTHWAIFSYLAEKQHIRLPANLHQPFLGRRANIAPVRLRAAIPATISARKRKIFHY